MPYHTAHHAFPGVPFRRLPELHREIVERAGAEPPTMGRVAFQREIVGRLARVDDGWAYARGETRVGGGRCGLPERRAVSAGA